MADPYAPLSISISTNEALSVDFTLKTKDDAGATIPLDLTGAIFKSEVRKPGALGDPLLPISVTIVDAPAGKIKLTALTSLISAMKPGSYSYEVAYIPLGGGPKSLWQAKFNVTQGIVKW